MAAGTACATALAAGWLLTGPAEGGTIGRTGPAPTDIVLALDESGSVNDAEFDAEQALALGIVNGLDDQILAGGNPGSGSVGIVLHGTNARVPRTLTGNRQTVINSINGLTAMTGGYSCVACGINLATTLLNGKPADHRKLVVVLADQGNTNPTNQTPDPTGLANSVAASNTAGVERISLGVDQASLSQTQQIASGPPFAFSGFFSYEAPTLISDVTPPMLELIHGYLADAMIRKHEAPAFVGDDEYAWEPQEQAVTRTLAPGDEAKFGLRIQNDALAASADSIAVDGPDPVPALRVRYLRGNQNVTGAVVNDNYTIEGLQQGKFKKLQLVVKAKGSANAGNHRLVTSARSIHSHVSLVDEVGTRIRVR